MHNQVQIAILADIHGNSSALFSVLKEIEQNKSIDQVIVLGDLVAEGPDPCGVVDQLQELSNLHCVMGNTDRWVVFGDLPILPKERWNESCLSNSTKLARICGWTEGMLSYTGKLDWIKNLPFQYKYTFPNEQKLLSVHANPMNDLEGFGKRTTIERQLELVTGCDADIIIAGHTHTYYENELGKKRVFVIPSLGLPADKNKAAVYGIMSIDNGELKINIKYVEYDYKEVVRRVEEQNNPAKEMITEHFV